MDPIDKLREDIASLERLVAGGHVEVAVLQERVANLKSDVDQIPSIYVTQDDFGPVKKVAYGTVGAIMMLFFTALGAIVFGGGGVNI